MCFIILGMTRRTFLKVIGVVGLVSIALKGNALAQTSNYKSIGYIEETKNGYVDRNYKNYKDTKPVLNSLNGVKVLYIYWGIYDTPNRLSSLGASVYQVHVNNLGNITADSLCRYDVVLVDIQAIWSLGFLSANLQSYVLMGGGYWINQPNQAGNVPTLPSGFSVYISSAWWNCGNSSCQNYTPLAPLHPMVIMIFRVLGAVHGTY